MKKIHRKYCIALTLLIIFALLKVGKKLALHG